MPTGEPVTISKKYFDIKRDMQYSCFCQACLTGKSEGQMSRKDTRYCAECQSCIEDEYKKDGVRERGSGRLVKEPEILLGLDMMVLIPRVFLDEEWERIYDYS